MGKLVSSSAVKGMVLALAAMFILSSCGSTEAKEEVTAETVFTKAKKLFDEEDYFEAQKLFEMMKLQYPASDYADDAQYYLAETNYKREEFILAAFNYGQLRRVHSSSPYYKDCVYKTALCFIAMSPTYDREQDYSAKAIQTLTEFQTLYPNDSLYSEASKYIEQMRDKLAHKEYAIAELYRKLYSPNSSIIYYDSVIDNYPDSKYFEMSYFGKIDAYFFMKKYEEAISVIEFYKKLFPKGEYMSQVNDIERQINEAPDKENDEKADK